MTIILITLLSCIANIIGTVSGFGLSTIMTPILLLFLPFTQTLLLVCILHWFHDIWKVILFHRAIDWHLFLYFGFPTIGAGFLGALLVTPEQSALLSSLLGLFLIGLVIFLLYKPHLSVESTRENNVMGGLLSGFLAGVFGIRGAIHVVFLSIFDVKKERLIGTTGIISLMLDSVRWITYWARGIEIDTYLYWALILFIPASFLGALIGQYILDKIPQKYFRITVMLILLFLGIRLLFSSWF